LDRVLELDRVQSTLENGSAVGLPTSLARPMSRIRMGLGLVWEMPAGGSRERQ
jgi:hypothetical protein